jgi:eukaryotic-like serine/threonine-protein kinase
MALGPGTQLDAYEIVRPLGRGGMGEVWLATELRLRRKVALKILPAGLTRDPIRVQRFEHEARAASALSHPNVCTIHALGETPDGQHYIAMEYVEGETLRQRLSNGRMRIREALDIAVQVAAALSAAHAAGIVHRDIKPENVMLRADGFVKVLDFGLAKLAPAADAAALDATQTAFRTEAGSIVGTVAYMSPEQARRQQVDARTDIWSLGVVLYEIVGGRSPFSASSSSEMLAAILEREPPPIARLEPEVPFELQRIVTKALRKDREQRYQVARDLLLDLQSLRDELQGRAAAESESRALKSADIDRTLPRWRAKRLVAVAAAICIVAILGSWWWGTWRMPGAGVKSATVERNLVRLTFDPGLQTEPTWSPDGRSIAYASDRAGNFDIWVQAVAGGEPVQLTRSPAQDTAPNWSPDGRRIAFRSERNGGGLFVIPAVGGPERQLSAFALYPEWVPDGSEILFRAGAVGVGWVRLYAVSAEGGEEPREILREFIGNGNWDWVASHPDGRISALGRHAQSGPGFFTVSRDGRSVTRSELDPAVPLPLQVGTQGRVVRFVWNATGTALYVEAVVNEVRNIWKVTVDPKTLA